MTFGNRLFSLWFFCSQSSLFIFLISLSYFEKWIEKVILLKKWFHYSKILKFIKESCNCWHCDWHSKHFCHVHFSQHNHVTTPVYLLGVRVELKPEWLMMNLILPTVIRANLQVIVKVASQKYLKAWLNLSVNFIKRNADFSSGYITLYYIILHYITLYYII